jgi:hypothetical protein
VLEHSSAAWVSRWTAPTHPCRRRLYAQSHVAEWLVLGDAMHASMQTASLRRPKPRPTITGPWIGGVRGSGWGWGLHPLVAIRDRGQRQGPRTTAAMRLLSTLTTTNNFFTILVNFSYVSVLCCIYPMFNYLNFFDAQICVEFKWFRENNKRAGQLGGAFWCTLTSVLYLPIIWSPPRCAWSMKSVLIAHANARCRRYIRTCVQLVYSID